MGNQLCCQANTPHQHPALEEIPFQQKIYDFLQAYPKVSKIIKQEKKSSKDLNQGFYDSIVKKIKPENLKEFQVADGIFIGDAKIARYQKNGLGLFLSHDGHYYEGEWKNNMKDGKGLYIDNEGETYDGQWQKDEPSGYGIFKSYEPFVMYKGQWSQGMKNGNGTQRYGDGSIYSGEFIHGNKYGQGKLQYSDGTYYQGQFIDNVLEGYGTFYGKNHKYQGYWKNGKMHGTGKSEWYNQKGQIYSKYIGEYVNGMKHGFGQYTDAKGITYKTNWIEGQMNEKGPMVVERPTDEK